MRRLNLLYVIVGTITLLLIFVTTLHADSGEAFLHRDTQGKYIDLGEWHPSYEDRCYFPGGINPLTKHTSTIKIILKELSMEPLSTSYLLDKARQQNTAYCIEDRPDGTRGYYDQKYNIIVIRENLDLPSKVLVFIHELRHVDQLSRGYCRPVDYDADEVIRMNFAAEADAAAVSALIAWKLAKKGFPKVWNKLLEISNYSDIFVAFKAQIDTSGDEVEATRIAFTQWYKSKWRTSNYYRSCLSNYLDILEDTKTIRRYEKMPEGFLDALCILPDGNNYDCHLTDEIQILEKK